MPPEQHDPDEIPTIGDELADAPAISEALAVSTPTTPAKSVDATPRRFKVKMFFKFGRLGTGGDAQELSPVSSEKSPDGGSSSPRQQLARAPTRARLRRSPTIKTFFKVARGSVGHSEGSSAEADGTAQIELEGVAICRSGASETTPAKVRGRTRWDSRSIVHHHPRPDPRPCPSPRPSYPLQSAVDTRRALSEMQVPTSHRYRGVYPLLTVAWLLCVLYIDPCPC